jgi:hypothetical protein
MPDNQPPKTTNRQEVEDRTAYLRDMLQYNLTKDDLIPVVREIARLMVSINSDISTLPELRNEIAKTQKLFLDFMEDQLAFRQQREQTELEAARKKVAQTETELNRTSQKVKAIKLTGSTGVPLSTASIPGKFSWQAWFIDRVLPYLAQGLIVGIVVLVGSALWLYFKTLLGLP